MPGTLILLLLRAHTCNLSLGAGPGAGACARNHIANAVSGAQFGKCANTDATMKGREPRAEPPPSPPASPASIANASFPPPIETMMIEANTQSAKQRCSSASGGWPDGHGCSLMQPPTAYRRDQALSHAQSESLEKSRVHAENTRTILDAVSVGTDDAQAGGLDSCQVHRTH